MVFPADSAARIDLGSVKSAELEESIGELETIRDFERFLRDAGGLSKGLAEALVSRAKLIFVQGSLSRSQPTRKQCRNCRQCCSECKRESRCNPPFIKTKPATVRAFCIMEQQHERYCSSNEGMRGHRSATG